MPCAHVVLPTPGDDLDLNVDRRLARLWSGGAPLDPAITNLAAHVTGDAAVVIAVSPGRLADVPSDLTTQAANPGMTMADVGLPADDGRRRPCQDWIEQ